MPRRKVKRRARLQSDELVREVVAAVVPAKERVRYAPFARELDATLRLKPQASSRKLQAQAQATRRVIPTKRSAGRNLAAEDRGRDPSIGGAQRTVGTSGVTRPAICVGRNDLCRTVHQCPSVVVDGPRLTGGVS